MSLTAEQIADLRRLEREWLATDRNVERVARMVNFQALLLDHAPGLLAAAEALLKINGIANVDNPTREEDMHRDFARRVCAVLDKEKATC